MISADLVSTMIFACVIEKSIFTTEKRPFQVTSMLIQMIGPQNQLFLSPELEPSTEMQFLFSLQLRFSYRDDRFTCSNCNGVMKWNL